MRSKIPTSVMIVLLIVSIIPVLAVEGGMGDADLTANVTDLPPVADAGGPYYGRPGRSISFDGTHSYDPDGEIESYAWNFGDGKTGTGSTTSHIYSSVGEYSVTLTITDNHDLMDIDTTTVYVRRPPPPPPINMKPKADAGPNMKISVGSTLHFSGAGSYDPDGMIVIHRWKFGDGTTATGVKVNHTYTEPGHYNVTLTVKDNRGAEDSDKCAIFVWKPPVPVADKFGDLVPGEQRGFKVNALKETNTTVTLNTTKQVTVTILKYDDNPHPNDSIPVTAIQIYVDVEVSYPDAVIWPIYVEMHYTDQDVEGINESSLGIYYWFNETWQRCSNTGVNTMSNIVWAYMTADEASGSPILIGGITLPKPAEFVISYLKIEPRQIELGGTVTISVNVTNIGETPGSYNVTLNIEEDLIISVKEVTIQGGESEIVKFEFVPEAEGTYDLDIEGMIGTIYALVPIPVPPLPPYLSNLTVTPTEIEFGDNVTISLDIRNMDNQSITYTVTMQIDELILLVDVELESYEAKTISRTMIMDTVGDFNVTVEGLTGGFTVKAPLKPAEFEFSNLEITPKEVELGTSVTISVDVTNIGEMGGVTVELKVNGEVVDSVEISPFGSVYPDYYRVTATQFFELTRGEGTYQVEVEGMTDSFTVTTPSISQDYSAFIRAFMVISIISPFVLGFLLLWRRRRRID